MILFAAVDLQRRMALASPNPAQVDWDKDGLADKCNPDQIDSDGDGRGDSCEILTPSC